MIEDGIGMSKLGIKKGDHVIVISGKDKGKRGKVIRALPAEGKLVVEGVNVMKKHQKATPKVMQGGIIEQEMPIPRANVMLVCPKCHKPTRVGSTKLADGRSVRVCKRCDEVLE